MVAILNCSLHRLLQGCTKGGQRSGQTDGETDRLMDGQTDETPEENPCNPDQDEKINIVNLAWPNGLEFFL